MTLEHLTEEEQATHAPCRECTRKLLVSLSTARAEAAKLRGEAEREQMRLAACGVEAHGGDTRNVSILPEYESDALTATRKLRDDRDALQAALRAIDGAREFYLAAREAESGEATMLRDLLATINAARTLAGAAGGEG